MFVRSSLVTYTPSATCRKLKTHRRQENRTRAPLQIRQHERAWLPRIEALRHDVESDAAVFSVWELNASLLLSSMLFPVDAISAETLYYDPSAGNTFLVNAAGAGYVLLVSYFLFRVLSRRAKRFKGQRIADSPLPFTGSKGRDKATGQRPANAGSQKKLTVVDGLIGVLQSGVLTVGLFIFTKKLDTLILSSPLPEQYTAHNIAITVRTIIRGFFYLFTFVFGMNFLGLSGLTIKLMIDPDSVNNDSVIKPVDIEPRLPKISVMSDPEEVARAFDEVSKEQSKDKPS